MDKDKEGRRGRLGQDGERGAREERSVDGRLGGLKVARGTSMAFPGRSFHE
ncbi:MAG: hypothetical protein ACUVRX_02515 [Actinomycetota bacterium]